MTDKAKTPKKEKVGESVERITGFDSHGARYFRMTVERELFQTLESPLNAWNVVYYSDGSFTAKPVRELIRVTAKTPKGAKA